MSPRRNSIVILLPQCLRRSQSPQGRLDLGQFSRPQAACSRSSLCARSRPLRERKETVFSLALQLRGLSYCAGPASVHGAPRDLPSRRQAFAAPRRAPQLCPNVVVTSYWQRNWPVPRMLRSPLYSIRSEPLPPHSARKGLSRVGGGAYACLGLGRKSRMPTIRAVRDRTPPRSDPLDAQTRRSRSSPSGVTSHAAVAPPARSTSSTSLRGRSDSAVESASAVVALLAMTETLR
jgi:hypothetical protein